jgi:hypothetical protein
MRERNANGEYSTASTPQPDDITEDLRDLLGCGGDGGIAGTDSSVARVRGAVLTSSSMTERRRAHGGRPEPVSVRVWSEVERWDPLTPRHALKHLTTLRPRRLRGAWLKKSAVGKTHSSVPTSVGRKRRITRTRLGAMAETRVIRAKGFRSLPVWQGEVVYGDLAHRDLWRAACVVEALRRARGCRRTLLRGSLGFGGTSRGRRLPNRFGLVRINGSITGAAGASRVQVIFRRRLLS